MSRGLWFVAGAGAGIWTMVRGRRAVEAVSLDGLRDRVDAAVLGARMLGQEVAAGKAEREGELRRDLAHRISSIEAHSTETTPENTRENTPELAGTTGRPLDLED